MSVSGLGQVAPSILDVSVATSASASRSFPLADI